MVRKRKSKPTSKRRAERQSVTRRLTHALDDAQRLGLVPTVPEVVPGLDKAVDPKSQEEQKIPSLDRQAIKKGWSVPEDKKPLVIQRLLEPFDDAEADGWLLKENAKVLISADQRQWERDNPEEAGRSKGGLGINLVGDLAVLLRRAEEQLKCRALEERIEKAGAPDGNADGPVDPEGGIVA